MKEDRGVLLFDDKEPKISGYLIIGSDHYQIFGQRISNIRMNLTIKKIIDGEPVQTDMFEGKADASSRPSESECDQS